MKIPESWLRSYCNPEIDAAGLEHKLTMSGLEVEERTAAAPPFSGVVVARVLTVRKHPAADRLSVCEVDAGASMQPRQVVCGAPNVRAGMVTALALPGAELPGSAIAGRRAPVVEGGSDIAASPRNRGKNGGRSPAREDSILAPGAICPPNIFQENANTVTTVPP